MENGVAYIFHSRYIHLVVSLENLEFGVLLGSLMVPLELLSRFGKLIDIEWIGVGEILWKGFFNSLFVCTRNKNIRILF